jgi:hypothetical protein
LYEQVSVVKDRQKKQQEAGTSNQREQYNAASLQWSRTASTHLDALSVREEDLELHLLLWGLLHFLLSVEQERLERLACHQQRLRPNFLDPCLQLEPAECSVLAVWLDVEKCAARELKAEKPKERGSKQEGVVW